MQNLLKRRGLMLVLSSPSGAGKTSLSRALLKSEGSIQLAISATTRKARPGEIDGVDYFFLDKEQFKLRIKNGDFLEYAEVFGNLYGTPKENTEKVMQSGTDILFDIDWQGTQQLAQKARADLVSIFILPPSKKILDSRLKNRAQDSEEVIRARMEQAAAEMSHWAEYDYIIVNDIFDESLEKLKAILCAERLKRERYTHLSQFVKGLCD